MNYVDITKCDIANGPGARVVLWCSGCDLACPGCHNEIAKDFDAGCRFNEEAMGNLVGFLERPWIQGLTITGGHPLAPRNIDQVIEIVKTIKILIPNKDIWLYTGYELSADHFTTKIRGVSESATTHNKINEAISFCDVVVDGPFVSSMRDTTLKFRGSANQRMIDVKKTKEREEIVLYE